MKKISFIIHGKHSKREKLMEGIRNTFSDNYEVAIRFTSFAGHAIQLAKEEADSGADIIVAAGGDGTLNETVNGILQSGNSGVHLGLLPCGTGNDYAKTIGAKNDIPHLYSLIEAGNLRKVDIGKVTFTDEKGLQAQRCFINITDVGMGGYIAQKITSYAKWMGATLTFQRAILTTFFSYQHKAVQLKADTVSYEGKMLSVIIAKGKYFGSGLGIAPHADPSGGHFAIVIGAEISLLDYLLNLGRVRQCKKVIHPQMSYHLAKEVAIATPENPLPIDMDGEFIGYTPLQVTLLPGAITLIA